MMTKMLLLLLLLMMTVAKSLKPNGVKMFTHQGDIKQVSPTFGEVGVKDRYTLDLGPVRRPCNQFARSFRTWIMLHCENESGTYIVPVCVVN